MAEQAVARRQADLEFLENYLFEQMDITGHAIIMMMTNGKIPGFTPKNYHKSPELVKNYARRQVKKLKSIKVFLEMYTEEQEMKEAYQDLSAEEYILKAALDEEREDVVKLAYFYLHYPEKFKEAEDIIKQNLDHERPVFERVIDPSLHTKMKAVANLDRLNEQIVNVVAQLTESEAAEWLSDEERSLATILEEELLPYPGSNDYLKLYHHYYDELETLADEERSDFIQLVTEDLILHYVNQLEQAKARQEQLADELEQATEQFEQLNKKTQRELEKTEETLAKREEKLKQAKAQSVDLQLELKQERRNYENLRVVNSRLEQQLKEKEAELAAQVEENKQLVEEAKGKQTDSLLGDLDFYFITKPHEALERYFTSEQMVEFTNVKELSETLASWDEAQRETVHFINIDGVPTKESFQFDELLNKYGINYRVVSGGASSIVRKIIYYLEGELRYEVKGKD